MLRLLFYSLSFCLLFLSLSCTVHEELLDVDAASLRAETARLRVLAIGNSFTDNSTFYIPHLLTATGNDDDLFFAKVVLGNSSLQQHWDNHLSEAGVYGFSFAGGGDWRQLGTCSIDYAISFADWDVIVLQQVSWLAGDSDSYIPYLADLTDFLRERCPGVEIGWQMTWAYAPYTSHHEFYRYGYDSCRMFYKIKEATDNARPTVDFIIPSGSLIEELRLSFGDAALYSDDGFHLREGLSCFALSSLWYQRVIAPFLSAALDKEAFMQVGTSAGISLGDAESIYSMILQINQL